MVEVIALTVIFFLPAYIIILRNFFWDLYFWQIKEYRFDRLMVHLFWDQDEKNRSDTVTGLKFIGLAMLSLVFEFPLISLAGVFFVYFVWLNEIFGLVAQLHDQSFKRASIKSVRNFIILISSSILVAFIGGLIAYPFSQIDRSDSSVGINISSGEVSFKEDAETLPDAYILLVFISLMGITLDLASPFIISLFVLFTSPLAQLKRQLVIRKAEKKYSKIKDHLKIVGITGSQGKTTTKEILFELIKDDIRTTKTPENYNTDFGVAQAMLNNVQSNTEVFIAEMGAYTIGEIEKICNSFPPTVSVITDMDTQHIGLFGSKANLAYAKSEIVAGMEAGGVAVLNADNEDCVKLAKSLVDKQVVLFSTKYDSLDQFTKHTGISISPKVDIFLASKIQELKAGVKFLISSDEFTDEVVVPQGGKHLVGNFLIAAIVAKLLGVRVNEIKKKLEHLKIKLPRLSVETGDNDLIIINDSYSSSFKGFIAAVDQMVLQAKKDSKKIVLTKGIYELGKEKPKIYANLIESIKDKVDMLITSDNLLIKVARDAHVDWEILKVSDFKAMVYVVRKFAKPGDVLLIEGRVNPRVLKELVSDNF